MTRLELDNQHLKARVRELEAAGRDLMLVVERTSDHTEWFQPLSRLNAVIEKDTR